MKIKDFQDFVRKAIGTKKLLEGQVNAVYENRRLQLMSSILHDTESGITDTKYTANQIIVSLTTYGKRIHDVAFTIESIMQQTMKANKIILWLDEGFQNQNLPESLKKQKKRGLEIAFCKDLRSYKKLIPALQHYPNDTIITIDDDAFYEYDLLEHLISAHLKDPHSIYAGRGRTMLFDKRGLIMPYQMWPLTKNSLEQNPHFFLTGVGGVLYPPHCLDDEVLNEAVFMDICKTADDVWFMAMAIKKGTKVQKIYTRHPEGHDYLTNVNVQDVGLLQINQSGEALNNPQIEHVFNKYNLWERLNPSSVILKP